MPARRAALPNWTQPWRERMKLVSGELGEQEPEAEDKPGVGDDGPHAVAQGEARRCR